MDAICELIAVSKSYGERDVLRDMSMRAGPGEMLAITGKSGSGKSTVLNIAGLLDSPDSGDVRLFGERSPRLRTRRARGLLREKIGYLFQSFALIDNASVDQNLEIAQTYSGETRREKQARRAAALERVGLAGMGARKVYGLSGGEQQRVAIARLLLKRCDLILADEPTASLDPDNREDVLRLLKELNREGKTVVIATHDRYLVGACDRAIALA